MITRFFSCQSDVQTFRVPAGVSLLHLILVGGQGGRLHTATRNGGKTIASLPVEENDNLTVIVGCAGKPNTNTQGGKGGFGYGRGGDGGSGSGARGASGGGGGTAVLYKDQVLVAGGAGGATGSNRDGLVLEGGRGGGEEGESGQFQPLSGKGGTQTEAGSGGKMEGIGVHGNPGHGFNGTDGGDGISISQVISGPASAGGGGGYKGGGGGAVQFSNFLTVLDVGAGGGGSGYIGSDMSPTDYLFQDARMVSNDNDAVGRVEIRHETNLTGKLSVRVVPSRITLGDQVYVSLWYDFNFMGFPTGRLGLSLYGPFHDYESISCVYDSEPNYYEDMRFGNQLANAQYKPTQAGIYTWQGMVTSDIWHVRYTALCGNVQGNEQIFVVDPIFYAQISHDQVHVGSYVSTTLTVQGIPQFNTEVTFSLYGPFATEDDINCNEQDLHSSKTNQVLQSISESDPFRVTKLGFYTWQVSFPYFGTIYTTLCGNRDNNQQVFRVDGKFITNPSSLRVDLGTPIFINVIFQDVEISDQAKLDITLFGPFADRQSIQCTPKEEVKIAFQETKTNLSSGTNSEIQSTLFTPTFAGFYIWHVVFREDDTIFFETKCENEDDNNTIIIDPLITAHLISADTIPIGSATSIEAKVTGMSEFEISARISFEIFGPFDSLEELNCSTTPSRLIASIPPDGTIDGNGTSITESPVFIPSELGYYTWLITLDQNSIQATTGCGDLEDTRQIFRVVPKITVKACSEQINLGSAVSVQAIIEGIDTFYSNDTMIFRLYGPFLEKSQIQCEDGLAPVEYVGLRDVTSSTTRIESYIPLGIGYYAWQVSFQQQDQTYNTTCIRDNDDGTMENIFHVGPKLVTLVEKEQVFAGVPSFINVMMESIPIQDWNPEFYQLDFYIYGPYPSMNAAMECQEQEEEQEGEAGTGIGEKIVGEKEKKIKVGTIQEIKSFPVRSLPFIPKAAGYYSWKVEFLYNGQIITVTPCGNQDGNVQLFRASPSASSAHILNDEQETIVTGTPVSLAVQVSGIEDFSNARIEFSVFGPFESRDYIDCQNGQVEILDPIVDIPDSSTFITSPIFTPHAAGFYTWQTKFVQNGIDIETKCGNQDGNVQEFWVQLKPVTLTIDQQYVLAGTETFATASTTTIDSTDTTLEFSVYGPFASKAEIQCQDDKLIRLKHTGTNLNRSPPFIPAAAGFYVWHAVLQQNGVQSFTDCKMESLQFSVEPPSLFTQLLGSDWLAGDPVVIESLAEGITDVRGIEWEYSIHGPFESAQDVKCTERLVSTPLVILENPSKVSFIPKAAGYYTWSVSFNQNGYGKTIPCGNPNIVRVGLKPLQVQLSSQTVTAGTPVFSRIIVEGITSLENSILEFRLYKGADNCDNLTDQLYQPPEVITELVTTSIVSSPVTITMTGFYRWHISFIQNGISIETPCDDDFDYSDDSGIPTNTLVFQVVDFGASVQLPPVKGQTGKTVEVVINITNIPSISEDEGDEEASARLVVYGPFSTEDDYEKNKCNTEFIAYQSDPITVSAGNSSISAEFIPDKPGIYFCQAILIVGGTILYTPCDGTFEFLSVAMTPTLEIQPVSTTSVVGTPIWATAIINGHGMDSAQMNGMVLRFSVYRASSPETLIQSRLSLDSFDFNHPLASFQVLYQDNQETGINSPHFVPCLPGAYFWEVLLLDSQDQVLAKDVSHIFTILKATPSLTLSLPDCDDQKLVLAHGFRPTGKMVWTLLYRSFCSGQKHHVMVAESRIDGNGHYSIPFHISPMALSMTLSITSFLTSFMPWSRALPIAPLIASSIGLPKPLSNYFYECCYSGDFLNSSIAITIPYY